MTAEPRKEHRWLQRLIGDWTTEAEMNMGPDKPPMKSTGTESVRPLGGGTHEVGRWVLCEGTGEMPGAKVAQMLMTLGYDPQKQRIVGTWIGSCMNHLWIYDGSLDAEERVLTLESEGPDFVVEGKTAKYRDIIEFENDDHRVMRSRVLGEDGKWTEFMVARYRRVR